MLNTFGLYLGFYLIGNLLANSIFGQTVAYDITRTGLLLWPVILIFFQYRKYLKFHQKSQKLSIIFLAIAFSLFSVSMLSAFPWESLSYSLITLVSFLIIQYFAFDLSTNDDKSWCLLYSMAGSIACIYILSIGEQTRNGRFESILNPNSLGLICMSILYTTMFLPKVIPRMLLFPLPAFTLLETNSRSSIIGLVLGLIFLLLTRKRSKANPLIRLMLIWLCVLSFGSALCFYWEEMSGIVRNVLAIDDPYRGIESGATGRVRLWMETWDIFLKNSIFGVGFRQHERYMFLGASSHNGYLATIAELGLVGSIPLIIFIVEGIRLLFKNFRNRRLEIAYIISYLFIGLFERYLFNVGNTSSLIFLFVIIRGYVRVDIVKNTQSLTKY